MKGLLIFLIVFGHIIEIYKSDYKDLYVFIYAFHMPLFIFVSGYLSKRVNISKMINLILVYLTFQTFFNWYRNYLGKELTSPFLYEIPQFHLWYIVSLVFWYAVALLISKLELKSLGKWIVLIVIFGVGFISRWYANDLVGFASRYYTDFSTYTFSYQRTLSFASFYFAGFFLTKKRLNKLYHLIKSTGIKVCITLLSFLLIFLYIQENPVMEHIFRGSYGTDMFLGAEKDINNYLILVSLHYIIAGWICLMILNFISERTSIITKWGDHSLTIFLFHPVFVFLIGKYNITENWNLEVQLLFLFSINVAICYVLGSNLFVKVTRYICNPYKSIKNTLPKHEVERSGHQT